jgi:hypothetical protein
MPPATPSVNRKEFGFGKTPAGGDAVILFGKEIPVQMAVAIVGGLGALLLFLRAKSTGGNVISAGTTAAATTTQPSAATTYSSSAYDPDAQAIADLQTAVSDLSSQFSTATTTSTGTAATTTASTSSPSLTDLSSEVLSGVGYNPPSGDTIAPITTPAGSYEWVNSQPAALAASQSGAQLYYQAEPGVFQPTSYSTWASSMPGSTALYVGVPAPQQPLPTSPTATASTSNGTLKAAASSAVSG